MKKNSKLFSALLTRYQSCIPIRSDVLSMNLFDPRLVNSSKQGIVAGELNNLGRIEEAGMMDLLKFVLIG
ncbi:CFC_HP_G0025060.mRNA.1.CDS.1 [Saccharomyces cerevisiae]|nr:CFC_HP_G0025060.mRNA.1.CDS.1 [Saccharomyces cerevisiae]CAI6944585.1 CFC_HP_G0025060.mRNA.1.CDS.1 [Saccharomyces cerevisiae]